MLPGLIQQLGPGKHFAVRVEAAKALAKFGKSAQPAIPALENMTNNSDDFILQRVVAYSIKAIEEDQKK